MVAPGIAQTMRDFHETNEIIGSLMVTIYILGFSIGPLFLGPFSEMFGRYPVVILSTWFLNAWILGSALAPSMSALIVFRLLAGIGGSAVMTISPAICADMFPVERRAFSTALITLAQCLGPACMYVWGFKMFLCAEFSQWALYAGVSSRKIWVGDG